MAVRKRGPAMKRLSIVLAAGALFGLGLVISGMTDARNVIGFLDFTGDWKPQLAAVMAGAVGVHAVLLRLLRRKVAVGSGPPDAADCAVLPSPSAKSGLAGLADRRLLAGAAIFGIGWGLSGYCPGPAIVSLGLGAGGAFAFMAATIAGILLAGRYSAAAVSTGDDG
jgi:uncharacterized protein